MKKIVLVLGILIMMAGTGLAQINSDENIDTVLLASSSNYPDAMISSSVSEKLGYPVIITEEGELSDSARTSLEDMDPNDVIMVGGPSVLSERVEEEASDFGNVTRLWGTTEVGTSAEVADYFWPEGSEEAVIVQYPLDDSSYHSLMAAVKNEAEDRPVLISKEGTLSASVLTAVEGMGVDEAEVYSTNAVNVTQDLEDSGVSDVEIETGEREVLEDDLRAAASTQNSEELVIVAAGNFRDTISVPNNPNSASYLVSSEDQISGAVTLVEGSDEETRIKVVGNPQLAQSISDRIEQETDRTVDMLSGSPEEISANQAREQRSEWRNMQQQKSADWRQSIQQSIRDRANTTLNRAERAVNENSSQRARNKLAAARSAYDAGNYFEARQMASSARSDARVSGFRGLEPSEVMERVREDRQDFREAAMEIRENNQEMAEELQDAESEEERREIVREYREERTDILMDRREDMEETGTQGEIRDRQERDAPDMTSTRLRLELDGNELEVDGNFVGRTGGYSVDRSLEVENREINGEMNFIPPSGPATQAFTEYETEMERTLENGDYTVTLELREEGNVRESISRSLTVPGEADIERRTNGIEAGGGAVELGDN